MTALAFQNDPALRDRVIGQVRAHEQHDEIVQGRYWENGKGCFIGCIAHSSAATDVEALTGFPIMLTRIAERIFEGLPNEEAKSLPARVLLAPRVGADLSLVAWKFLHWVVTDALGKYADEKTRASCQPAVDVLAALASGREVSSDAAARAAAYAADAADAAADAAAYREQGEKLIELLAAA